MKHEEGYSFISVLILILFFSAVALSVLLFLQTSLNMDRKQEEYYKIIELLEEEVYALIEVLADDPTPEADSSFDPVWDYVETRNSDELTIILEDLSSRFNLNFVRTKMLEYSSFKDLFINGNTPEDLKLYRGENGFFTDLKKGYEDFFDDETLEKYFTAYSYANLNITYEDSLKKLYEYRVSEEGSHVFLGKVQQLISGQEMADEERMQVILGGDFDDLYPLINVEPLMNVNFVDEKVLEAVLKYPYGEVVHQDSSAFLDILKTERAVMEIDSDRLKTVLDVEDNSLRIPEYLGCRTWFWGVDINRNDVSLSIVFAAVPGEIDERKYSIIERRIDRNHR